MKILPLNIDASLYYACYVILEGRNEKYDGISLEDSAVSGQGVSIRFADRELSSIIRPIITLLLSGISRVSCRENQKLLDIVKTATSSYEGTYITSFYSRKKIFFRIVAIELN